jgi:hypothetical protein
VILRRIPSVGAMNRRFFRHAGALLAVAAGMAAASSAAAGPPSRAGVNVRLALRPAVAALHEPVSITVGGVGAPDVVAARLVGATDAQGRRLPWSRLRWSAGSWHGVLAPPALLGIYPVEIRRAQDTTTLLSGRWLVRVFRPGTLERPSFATPEQVARDWVTDLPGHQVLVALRHWPLPGFDRRDPRLHRLLVIAYEPSGDRRLANRLGMWVTAVRDGYHGRWRLLQATVTPR